MKTKISTIREQDRSGCESALHILYVCRICQNEIHSSMSLICVNKTMKITSSETEEKQSRMKLKSLCTAKETVNRVKRQPTGRYLQSIYLISG